MELVSIKPSKKGDKRLVAKFEKNGREKNIHFGAKGGSTYVDHKDKDKRSAWLARHRVRGTFNRPDTASSLAKHILWGSTTSQRENISRFKSKFDL